MGDSACTPRRPMHSKYNYNVHDDMISLRVHEVLLDNLQNCCRAIIERRAISEFNVSDL